MEPSVTDPHFWDDRYLHKETDWDMGEISPPLKAYFDQLSDKTLSILIPGCGNSYEASYLLENNFSAVTLIDISEVLVTRLREKFRHYSDPPLKLVNGNFFDLQGQYDLVVEQTFFCALDPALRKDYVEKMYDLLAPGGKLAGLLFDKEFPGGPPFGGSKEEYAELLSSKFTIRSLAPCYNSIKPRAGAEVFMIVQKR